jgi:hypothetical protein
LECSPCSGTCRPAAGAAFAGPFPLSSKSRPDPHL